MHDSRSCKRTFLPSNSKGGDLPTQALVHDSRCCKLLLYWPLERGKSYQHRLMLMTPDVANDFYSDHQNGKSYQTQTQLRDSRCYKRPFFEFSHPHMKSLFTQTLIFDSWCCKQLFSCPLESLTHPNSSTLLQVLQATYLLPICKGRVLLTQTLLHNSTSCNDISATFLVPISKGGVLFTKTLVHDSTYCKRHFSCALARVESYPPKLYCLTPDVARNLSPAL